MSCTPRGGAWQGDEYQRKFDALATSGVDVHGEASFVMRFAPRAVLDAGCGTGRVATELAARGVDVVGVDVDRSMLATARDRAADVEWIEHDLTTLDLGRVFDVVVMAGNVPLFTPAGTHAELVAGCARHVAPECLFFAWFSLRGLYSLATRRAAYTAARVVLDARFATWDADPFANGDYALSVHRRTGPA